MKRVLTPVMLSHRDPCQLDTAMMSQPSSMHWQTELASFSPQFGSRLKRIQ
jgi:hypothetical protein